MKHNIFFHDLKENEYLPTSCLKCTWPEYKLGRMLNDMGISQSLADIMVFFAKLLVVSGALILLAFLAFLIEGRGSGEKMSSMFAAGHNCGTTRILVTLSCGYLIYAICKFLLVAVEIALQEVFGAKHRYVLGYSYLKRATTYFLFSMALVVFSSKYLSADRSMFEDIFAPSDPAANPTFMAFLRTLWDTKLRSFFSLILIFFTFCALMLVEKGILYVLADIYNSAGEDPTSKRPLFPIFEKLRRKFCVSISGGLADPLHALRNDLEAARKNAEAIFRGLKSTDPTQEPGAPLHYNDFLACLPDDEAEMVFARLEVAQDDYISLEDFQDAFVAVYEERLNYYQSKLETSSVFGRLESLLTLLVAYNVVMIAANVFGLTSLFILSVMLESSTLGLLAIDSTISLLFKSMIMLFIIHSFDVGDQIIFKDKTYTVKSIHFFVTVLVGEKGATTYITNEKLADAQITNIKRSGNQSVAFDVSFDPSSYATTKVAAMKRSIDEFLKKNHKDYYADVGLGAIKMKSADELIVNVCYRHKSNFNDAGRYRVRACRFNRQLYAAIAASGLEFGTLKPNI